MNIFQKIANLFQVPASGDEHSYYFSVRCLRCGEEITGRVDLRNDLSLMYADTDGQDGYTCRKVLVGEGQNYCFQTIEVILNFDRQRNLIEQRIQGGKFIENESGESR